MKRKKDIISNSKLPNLVVYGLSYILTVKMSLHSVTNKHMYEFQYKHGTLKLHQRF